MTLLLKDGQPVTDSWQVVEDGAALVPEGPVIVSLERWQRERLSLLTRNTPLGVALPSQCFAGEIAADLERLALVALTFPSFRDGRAFSAARELRERYGFTGEVRALGHVLPDQYQFLLRAGFTTVVVPDGANLASWQQALSAISVAYQTGVADEAPLSLLRRRVSLDQRAGQRADQSAGQKADQTPA